MAMKYPTQQQRNTHFSRGNETFFGIDHMLGHKTNLNINM